MESAFCKDWDQNLGGRQSHSGNPVSHTDALHCTPASSALCRRTELPLLPRIHGRRCRSSQVRASAPTWGKVSLSVSLLSLLHSPPPTHPSQPGEGILAGPAGLSPWSIRWPGGQDRLIRHRHGTKSPNLELNRAVRRGGGKLRMASCWEPQKLC